MAYYSPKQSATDKAEEKIAADPDYHAGLIGSPPQISWAADVRSAALAQLDDVEESASLRSLLLSQKQSSWWINRRHLIRNKEMESICRTLTGDENLVLLKRYRRSRTFDELEKLARDRA